MAVLGMVECPSCDHKRAEVREGKNGAASIFCPECGSQTLAKSPKASAALRARVLKSRSPAAAAPSGSTPAAPKPAAAAPASPAPQPPKRGWLDGL